MHNRQNSAVTAGDSSSLDIGFEEDEILFERKSLIQERERVMNKRRIFRSLIKLRCLTYLLFFIFF